MPPDGTVSIDPDTDAEPVPVDRALLDRGRDRYEVFCAACHGLDGAAATPVARAMPLPPRDLRSPELVAEPGRIRAAIQLGYGLMPSYADRVSGVDAEAVAAWVQVLQNVEVPLDRLPPELRARVLQEIP